MDEHMTRAELARRLGVSRTYVTLLVQGKRKPSQQLVNKIRRLGLTSGLPEGLELTPGMVGKGGLEPPRLAAHDPKSCPSASSGTPP
jgi:transcriptional regulator with XRE-family HTH domain